MWGNRAGTVQPKHRKTSHERLHEPGHQRWDTRLSTQDAEEERFQSTLQGRNVVSEGCAEQNAQFMEARNQSRAAPQSKGQGTRYGAQLSLGEPSRRPGTVWSPLSECLQLCRPGCLKVLPGFRRLPYHAMLTWAEPAAPQCGWIRWKRTQRGIFIWQSSIQNLWWLFKL